MVRRKSDYQYTPLAPQEGAEGHKYGTRIPYPRQIFFIIGNEACERFSFFGMNAILIIYIIHILTRDIDKYTSSEEANEAKQKAANTASIVFHAFKFFCTAFPLLGAILADSFFGKYRTILYLSVIYTFGQATLALGSVGNTEQGILGWPNQPISYIGLLIIAVGTGGIKPCVVTLGADQFKMPEQARQMTTFFGLFYASINLGGLISTITTPFLRSVKCMGEESCFVLAFSLPAVLMAIATVVFILGRPFYTVNIPDRNIILEFFKCIGHAISRSKHRKPGAHWLEAASDRYDSQLIEGIQAVLRVGVLFLVYPMFWALFDQQGSRWTIQATHMNGNVFGWYILPDQMQASNPVLILLFIPLFDRVIYPLLGRFGLLKTPLQRVVTGGFLAAVSFIVSGLLELELEKSYPRLPLDGKARLNLYNGLDCDVTWEAASLSLFEDVASGVQAAHTTLSSAVVPGNLTLSATGSCLAAALIAKVSIGEKHTKSGMLTSQNSEPKLIVPDAGDILDKSENTHPYVRVLYNLEGLKGDCDEGRIEVGNAGDHSRGHTWSHLSLVEASATQTIAVDSLGESTLSVGCEGGVQKFNKSMRLGVGGSYTIFVSSKSDVSVHTLTEPNTVHIYMLLPQYVIITAGEILFSVTSLEFAYSQAPTSMKSVLQALYLLTMAFGNLIDVLVILMMDQMRWSQSSEFFLFSGLMTACMLVLMLLSLRYQYVTYSSDYGDLALQDMDRISSSSEE